MMQNETTKDEESNAVSGRVGLLVSTNMELDGEYHADCNKLMSEIKRLKFELLMVSKFAADEPMFFNPLNAAHAKSIRDKVLANANNYV